MVAGAAGRACGAEPLVRRRDRARRGDRVDRHGRQDRARVRRVDLDAAAGCVRHLRSLRPVSPSVARPDGYSMLSRQGRASDNHPAS
ncbi:hypothetical protein F01_410171 [Burkholderia cenocepacia]|nr:hypothetical protein F01_410171 [Burkholderia cenocepacia]